MCFPNSHGVGYVAGNIALIHTPSVAGAAEMWRPVDVDGGHRDDTLVTFTHKPTPDPLAKYGDDEETLNSLPKEEWDAADKWLELARGEMANLLDGYETRGVWRLVETLQESGYNPDEDETAELWLYARAGEIAATL